MTTLTNSLAVTGVQPKLTHEGVNVLYGQYAAGARNGVTSLSAGDIILLGKIPHGATVIDGWVVNGGEAFGMAIGTLGDPDRFLATSTVTTRVQLGLGFPYTVSVSDGAVNRFEYLTADIENDITSTSTIGFCLYYTAD